jgi:predicted amidophosphoribosyltransferase
VFALGRYAGPRRAAILAVKERGRTDLIGPLGDALRSGLTRLLTWGVVSTPLIVVPAPTRATAARRRGGDPVARMARIAAAPGVTVVDALRMRAFTKDSVGLSAGARQRNVAGRIRVRRSFVGSVGAFEGELVLVDDVVTTGATATESVRVLQTAGAGVVAVLAIANA